MLEKTIKTYYWLYKTTRNKAYIAPLKRAIKLYKQKQLTDQTATYFIDIAA